MSSSDIFVVISPGPALTKGDCIVSIGMSTRTSCPASCAAVAVGIQQGLLAEEVRVELPGGRLDIAWKGPGHPLYMTGPAAHVYDGFIHL